MEASWEEVDVKFFEGGSGAVVEALLLVLVVVVVSAPVRET